MDPTGQVSRVLYCLFISIVGSLSLFVLVFIFTSLRFQYDLYKFRSSASNNDLRAPRLPVIIPWIGNAPSFLSMTPNGFWIKLFAWYPRNLGAVSITLGGNESTIIFDRFAASYLLKDRKLGREEFNEQVIVNGFGSTKAEARAYYEHHLPREGKMTPGYVEAEKMNHDYLLKPEHVNEMTGAFVQFFLAALDTGAFEQTVALYAWLRRLMFSASITALMGSKILEVVPDFEELFFDFDSDVMSLFFGLPNFLVRKQISCREKAINVLLKWHGVVRNETEGLIVDPEDKEHWEPYYGSRINRAR